MAPRRRVPASGRLVTGRPGDAAEDFRARADQSARRALQIEHERGRIDDPQGAIDIERIGRGCCTRKPLAWDELEDVAGLDVFLAGADGVFELRRG